MRMFSTVLVHNILGEARHKCAQHVAREVSFTLSARDRGGRRSWLHRDWDIDPARKAMRRSDGISLRRTQFKMGLRGVEPLTSPLIRTA
jgi:hypothetical protein